MIRSVRLQTAGIAVAAILAASCQSWCPGGGSTTAPPPPPPPLCDLTGLTASATPDPRWPSVSSGTVSGPTLTLPAGATINVTGDLTIVTDQTLQIDGTIILPRQTSGRTFGLKLISLRGKVVIGPSGKIQGGNGGHGGNVVLCGVDGIRIGGSAQPHPAYALIEAGDGGNGGNAIAVEDGNVTADGGNGGLGGDIVFVVRPGSGPTKVTVDLLDDTTAGNGGDGGQARASSNDKNATATAGNGDKGGTVKFPSAMVNMNAGTTRAGNGGQGRTADANGGTPSGSWVLAGDPGGNGTAKAGDGGPAGTTPVIPLLSGATANGAAGNDGGGGTATATGGGGTPGGLSSSGGTSGVAKATGGKNGKGVAPTPVPPVGPLPATGATPASRTPVVTAPGQP